MLDQQLEILKNGDRDYLSIGITQGGIPRRTISIPWDLTVSAFNMKTPTVYIAPEDLENPEIMALLESYQVRGLYCFVPLSDYSFIARFPTLWDIYLLQADAVQDLRFMKGLTEWKLFLLQDARISDLSPLLPEQEKRTFRCCCLGLVNCTVDDVQALKERRIILSELVIGMPKGTGQRKRWKEIGASHFTYYEF